MKANLNDVSEVELNFMGFRCIGESIERLLRRGFEVFDNTDDFVNGCLVDQSARAINEQANVLVKLNFRWKCHCSLETLYELLSLKNISSSCALGNFQMPSFGHKQKTKIRRMAGVKGRILPASYSDNASSGTPSHLAAAARSVNKATWSGEWSVSIACSFV
jgi:hypothetical protein